MSSNATPDKLRRLADALEAAEEAGVEVDGVESYTVDGELIANVDVGVGPEPETPDQSTTDDVVDADASAVDPADEPAPSTPAESDIAPGDLEDEEDDFDPDEAVERLQEAEDRGVGEDYIGTESGLRDELEESEAEEEQDGAICSECGESHDDGACWDEDATEDDQDDEPEPDGVAGEVLAALREEGECTPGELEMITGVSDAYYALGKLEDDDLLEKRKDPEDGRRTLYSAADWLVEDQDDDSPEWNGRDPETIVADSSLPARVVLDDILDVAAGASTVREVAEALDVSVAELDPVLWELNLKELENRSIVDDVDEQVETILEVVSA